MKPVTALSVNINKIATLRNSRNNGIPNVVQFALDCEEFGADGITVHPRPDERHIRRSDVYELKQTITTELNIEGYPTPEFVAMVLEIRPAQVTLVPDAPDALTSNAGWDTVLYYDFLKPIIQKFKEAGIRTSIFLETNTMHLEAAAKLKTDRIELYTEFYSTNYVTNPFHAIEKYITIADLATQHSIGVNAGHDLNLQNLAYFATSIPALKEVSIGHALVADALYYGIANTLQLYKRALSIST